MRVLIGCERSQVVTKAFRLKGHEAYSCDIEDCLGGHPEWHIKGDVLNHLDDGWDLGIFHPVCKFLANSGVQHLHLDVTRWVKMYEGAWFFKKLLDCEIKKKCIENPIMHKYGKSIIGRGQDQLIQPWMFGHPESKATCLWLDSLPRLKPTEDVKEVMSFLSDKEKNKVHHMPPSEDREYLRSITYQGIADAMADQWGTDNCEELFG